MHTRLGRPQRHQVHRVKRNHHFKCSPKRKQQVNTEAEKAFNVAVLTATRLADATDRTTQFFEDVLGMEVSKNKSCIISNVDAVSMYTVAVSKYKKVAALCTAKGQRAKMLGITSAAGGRRCTKGQEKRRKDCASKRERIQQLG